MSLKKEHVSAVNKLLQTDVDAVVSYKHCVEGISMPEVKEKIREFLGDHERHVEELSKFLKDHGATPIELKPDAKGLVLGTMTLAMARSDDGIMRAMYSNEKVTNKEYEAALSLDLPDRGKRLVKKNREDEARHLKFVEETLRANEWLEV